MKYGTTEYKEMIVVGDHVLLEKKTTVGNRMSKGVLLPEYKDTLNNKIGVGKIIGIGKKAKEQTNLSISDVVLYDYFSAHDDHGEVILTDSENIIAKINESDIELFLNGESILN
jgi:co-chaperonin GroES (HSP10)